MLVFPTQKNRIGGFAQHEIKLQGVSCSDGISALVHNNDRPYFYDVCFIDPATISVFIVGVINLCSANKS